MAFISQIGYNDKYDYPVFVVYFDDIYDDQEYRDEIHKDISPNIHFRSIPYESPSHVSESEMFYNQKSLWYVKNGNFDIGRKGYLHMCNYRTNFYGYLNTEFEKYDYMMSHDDESGYLKPMEEDPFVVIADKGVEMAAYITGQRLRDGKPHQGHRDTRMGIWAFAKRFIEDNGVDVKFKPLKDLMDDENAEENFHYLPWSDSYVFNLNFAKTDLWKKWVQAINDDGGIYKFRWGDNEIISVFGMMYQDQGIVNLGYVENSFYNQGMFRGIQNVAPSVKELTR